jgi:flavin-dependent dehydrogenase
MKTDVLIIGGGPAGSAAAMFLLKEGISPVIVENEPFPRYHIGESTAGAAGQVLRELGLEREMCRRQYPVKQGVKVYGQSTRGTWFVPVMGRDEQGNLAPWDTWQVRRSDFDKLLLDEAVARGATLIHGKAIKPLVNDGVTGAHIRMADGGSDDVTAQVVLDCTGLATWLANHGGITGPKYLGAYDKQIAIFSQVAGALRDEGTASDRDRDRHRDNTLIFYRQKYEWAWFIPIDREVVSVGIVVPAAYFLGRRETTCDFLVRELRELHPELARRVEGCPLVEDVHVIPNYSYQVRGFCGRGFMCLGDAHRFVDPIFSFGLMAAIREAQFAAPAVREYLEGRNRDDANPFAHHQLFCEKGIDALEDMIDSFWEHPLPFAWAVNGRLKDQVLDIFAGRVYESEKQQPTAALASFRKLLGRAELREESYVRQDLYSVPIGSRYHPERAAIWNRDAAVPTTEHWMEPS